MTFRKGFTENVGRSCPETGEPLIDLATVDSELQGLVTADEYDKIVKEDQGVKADWDGFSSCDSFASHLES